MPNRIEDYSPETRIFALHISRSGDGKSAAAASYEKPFHQFDFDGRFDGVWGACKPQGFLDPSQITFDRMYTRGGYQPFQDKLTELENYKIVGQFPYKSIELASATNMVQCLMNSSHSLQGGRFVGKLRMPGPADFNFETVGLKQILDFLQTLPCHVIVSAHIIQKWGKPKPRPGMTQGQIDALAFAQNEPIGEKLLLRDQTGENILTYFSNVFRFSREVENDGQMHYYVEFATDVAKNAFGIPPGQFDITGKPFYPFLQDLIKKVKEGKLEMPKTQNTNIFG